MRRTEDPNRCAVHASKHGIHLTINNWVVSIIPATTDGHESALSICIWDIVGNELDVTGYGAFCVDNAITLEQVLKTLRLYGLHEKGAPLLAGMLRSCIGMTAQEYDDHKSGAINEVSKPEVQDKDALEAFGFDPGNIGF